MNSIDFELQKVKATFSHSDYAEDHLQIKVFYLDRWIKIPMEKIVRLEGDCNYTYIYTQNREYLAARTLKDFEKMFGEELFLRIHKSHLVNMMFVKGVEVAKNAGEIKIEGGRHIGVSRRRLKEVINKLAYFHSA
ncbi:MULTISPECIES: LytTR family DNA-binding domain-containing protein [unclassified Emticicia]|uniref:LytR/AlgR family response regulator transcription factor n=1 Tax=unclassified Emticicia TaxID=2627301 RepID=UPI000C770FBA|nr:MULTISPECIES: LytTR family DNA-binding domain-containing protein [unclassified Emticicia]PLK45034.1 LytTR family transcriptional regulator [Emticicia sp. TH156]UTA67006.1 LytTR family transcriptional regulator [Emticicia sp. 21SJ11W-3]